MHRSAIGLLFVLLSAWLAPSTLLGQQLEIHYINVGWGASVLVVGPDGTTVLIDAGNTGDGSNEVVPYLQLIGILPVDGLDYTIVSHQHCDHNGGMDEVVNAGYDVHFANYDNGSSYSTSCVTQWNSAAASTTAGAPITMPVGTVIQLGNGAILTCVARNGYIIGGGHVSVSDENDRSIAVLVQYGSFDFLYAGDMGGGDADSSCTGRSTTQVNVESYVIQAISPGGASPLISAGGIDVLNCNHHGSESSTNPDWMNLSEPAVAVISTGAGQSSGWDFPRKDVVENVLLAQATACITVPAALVLQTEEGSPTGPYTSFAGYCVGDVQITTDGNSTFTVSADGDVNQGPNEVSAAGLPATLNLDDASVCTGDPECDDGQFCNGVETCDIPSGNCQPGTPPDCSDSVGCTDDSCNEATDSCDHVANDANCDNGQYCDGAETCDPVNDCQPGTAMDCNDSVGCTDDSCNEGTDSCDNVPNDSYCDNGQYCDGAETCDPVNDCQPGTAVDCDDSVGCTDDSCNESTDSCDNVPNDGYCDNGQYCDGAEWCDEVLDCQAGADPCPGEDCDEINDQCVPVVCDNDGTCEAGEDCNNCPNDCIGGSGGAVCGNGLCEAGDGEDCLSCPEDCNGVQTGKPSGRFCCGATEGCDDSRCNDAGWSCTTEPQGTSYCCGDSVCEGAEDINNCAIDCGCSSPADCDDGNECTVNDCVGGACENTPVADDTPCSGGVCCGGTCVTPVCSVDGDCTDGETCTTDTCYEGDTCSAYCDNAWPACGVSDGCCGPDCDSGNDPDCESCVPAGEYCASDEDCCSNNCHPGKHYCR